ncbi:Protein psi1 [Psilocybe cubensis]|uniref:Protein psi1 n=2 Tax=Psilocybe cubensis TaxID=181762 RepID=A0ACB8H0T1_PSICU|nr:Protein psi1 [Psilocybe cubensis]KAH9481292.1 Protein psi1 [Psilocybe cubensis]
MGGRGNVDRVNDLPPPFVKGLTLLMLTMSVQDAYRILEIFEDANSDEIKHAYRITALKWHPDRQHNAHDKETSTRHFLEVTNAYRTLVREGFVKPKPNYSTMAKDRTPQVPRPPPLAHQTSSDSSVVSLDSFIHLVASSDESHTTAPPSNRESLRSSWKQGVREPVETLASHYRNLPNRPHTFYEAPTKGAGTGPALYRPTTPFTPIPRNPEPIKVRAPQSKSSKPPKVNGSPRSSHLHLNNYPYRSQAYHNHATPPYSIPLVSIGLGSAGEWVYSLAISLEELFTGKHFRFGISRAYLSGKAKSVVIEIDIPSGCRPGTRILCRNVGHEWKPGVFQDIAFIIEEAPHERFVRLYDDLVMDVRLPWVDSLRRQGGKVPFMGIDGRSLIIQIDYPRDKKLNGRSIIKGAGMPIREQGKIVGRGDLIIQWEILPPKTKILHFVRRLWGGN